MNPIALTLGLCITAFIAMLFAVRKQNRDAKKAAEQWRKDNKL